MRKFLGVLLLVSAVSACNSSKKDKEVPEPVVDPTQFVQLRDTIKQDLAANNAVGVSVAIYQDGKIVFAEAFGEKVQGQGEVPTQDTLFQMGSVTKMFTGLATQQLIQQGLLGTQDKLVNILPDIQYPADQALNWQDVSVHHLLTHQSGFLDRYFGISANSDLVDYMTSSYPQLNKQMNPPGRFHNYSNPNWSYLGAIIEHLSQKPYATYMRQNVFAPLGMQRTSMERGSVISDGDYALGFQTGDGEDMFLNDISQIPLLPSAVPAGTETWSTPTEVLKMAEFLLKGNSDVLTHSLRQEITTPHVSTEFAGLPLHYGYGIYVDDGFMHGDDWYPQKVWQHSGNTTAFTSMFWILPEKNVAVSIMSSGAFNDLTASMLAALTSVTDLPAPQTIPVANSNPEEYEKHEGIYDTGDSTIIVNQEDGQLSISIPELDAGNVPYNKSLFVIGGATFQMEIENRLLEITFFPEGNSDESVYLRERNVVGIKDGY